MTSTLLWWVTSKTLIRTECFKQARNLFCCCLPWPEFLCVVGCGDSCFWQFPIVSNPVWCAICFVASQVFVLPCCEPNLVSRRHDQAFYFVGGSDHHLRLAVDESEPPKIFADWLVSRVPIADYDRQAQAFVYLTRVCGPCVIG